MQIQAKEFSFIKRFTMDKVAEAEEQDYRGFFLNLDETKFKGKEYRAYRKKWRHFCFDLFDLPLWRKALRMLPKELRFSQVEPEEFQEVALGFFVFVAGKTSARNGQQKLSSDSEKQKVESVLPPKDSATSTLPTSSVEVTGQN